MDNNQYENNNEAQPTPQNGAPQYQQPNQQYQQPNPQYGGPQYNNPPVFYNNGGFVPQHGPVSDLWGYLVVASTVIQLVIGIIMTVLMMNGISPATMMDGSFMLSFFSGGVLALTIISYAIMIAAIVFVVIDIVKINKEKYPITGLILFAIFLRPAYYLWRCHILKRKMVPAVIYTIVYYVIYVVFIIWTFYKYYLLMINVIMSTM